MRIITKDYSIEKQNKVLIKNNIVELLRQNNKCMFGQFIKEIDHPYSQITKCIIELKQNGVLTNETNPPYFTLCKY